MKIFVVRLNPDPRIGKSYSKYPTLKEYEKIHKASPMNGFHEAVNFLSESGVVRGYLPPGHLNEMKTSDEFALITITAKTAKQNGDMIYGIQSGCKYVGNSVRTGGNKSSKKLELTYHYSCPAELSLLFDKPMKNARNLVLTNSRNWGQRPTYVTTKRNFKKIIKKAIDGNHIEMEKKKLNVLMTHIIDGTGGIVSEYDVDSLFEDEVSEILDKGKLPKVNGNPSPLQKEIISYQYIRNPKVAAYALLKANGVCQDCGENGPFISKKTNTPFLEVHHVVTLKNGGGDIIENVIALCPNCHRKRHYG